MAAFNPANKAELDAYLDNVNFAEVIKQSQEGLGKPFVCEAGKEEQAVHFAARMCIGGPFSVTKKQMLTLLGGAQVNTCVADEVAALGGTPPSRQISGASWREFCKAVAARLAKQDPTLAKNSPHGRKRQRLRDEKGKPKGEGLLYPLNKEDYE